jgi:hypothetical protein
MSSIAITTATIKWLRVVSYCVPTYALAVDRHLPILLAVSEPEIAV